MTPNADYGARPLLYVAAPYISPDPVINTHKVIRIGTIIYQQTEFVPFLPHLSMLWHAVDPQPVDFWYEIDLQYLNACQYIVRLPGASTGADKEVTHAHERGIPEMPYHNLPAQARALWAASPNDGSED